MGFVIVSAIACLLSAVGTAAHLLRRRPRRRHGSGTVPDPRTAAARKAIFAGCVAATIAYAMSLPGVITAVMINGWRINWLIGITVGNSVVLCVRMFLLFCVEDDLAVARRKACRDTLIYLVMVLATIIVFTINPTASDYDLGPHGRLRAGGPGDPSATVGWMLMRIYGVVMNIVVCRSAWHWANKSRAISWLALGLRANALGQIIAAVMALHALCYLTALLIGVVPPWTQESVETPLKGPSGLLTMGGISAAVVSHLFRNNRFIVWQQANRARRKVYRLWKQMSDLLPTISYNPPPRSALADVLEFRHAQDQLTNRIVEMWDARVKILAFAPKGTRRLALDLGREAGLDGPELDAVVEASCLAVAFEMARAGVRVRGSVEPATEASRVVQDTDDLAVHLRWWLEVDRALRKSPVVAAARSRTRELAAAVTNTHTTASTGPSKPGREPG